MSNTEGGGCATLIGLGVVLGVGALFFVDYEAGKAAALLLGALIVLSMLFGPRSCQVCKATIKRTSHRCVVDGKSLRVCPNCNGRITRKQSRQAVDRLFGE